MIQRCIVIERLQWANPNFRLPVPLPFPQGFANFYPINLTPDSFTTGPSDYDIASDEIYCPCGKVLSWKSGIVGEAYRLVVDHMREAHGK